MVSLQRTTGYVGPSIAYTALRVPVQKKKCVKRIVVRRGLHQHVVPNDLFCLIKPVPERLTYTESLFPSLHRLVQSSKQDD
jgi:hypothetical protein